jgi:inosine-uridine nucleoside N-ribohydrolase
VLTALLVITAAACGRQPLPTDGRAAVWLDISPAIGDPPRDPGDALALLQAYGSDRLRVRGVSVTFGNVPLVRGYPTAQEILERLDTGLLRPWRGASSPEERAAPTEATELLEEALGKEALTFIATGPATTLASVLLRQPEIATRLERVVMVGGRPSGVAGRESRVGSAGPEVGSGESGVGSQAQTTESRARAQVDPAVAVDATSVRILLDSPVPITLVPAVDSPDIGLNAADIDRLDTGRGPIKLITPSARGWLQGITATSGDMSFPVPAMLAVDVVAHPGEVRCEAAVAALVTDTTGAPALRVSAEPAATGRPVTWCHTADPGAKARMLDDVLRVRPLRQ